jgi:putative inorganic carbon (hco3(-)) transporter
VLAAVKELLKGAMAPALYVAMWAIFFGAVFRRAEWALYLLVAITPQPTIWYRLHEFPLGTSALDILVLGTAIGVFVNKSGFQRAPASGLLFTFLLVSYMALWNAALRFGLPWPLTTDNPILGDWKNYAEMIFLYFLTYNAIRDERQQQVLVTIIAAVVLVMMVREVRNFSEGASFSYDKRAEGPFWMVGLGANHFGAFIAHYCSLLFGLFLIDKHKHRKWLYLGAVGYSIFPLFFAYSRGAYIAALAAITILGLLKKRSLLVAVALLALTWQMVLPTTVVERISMTETSSGKIEESAAHRFVVWQIAISDFTENMVFGVGFNAFGYTVPEGELTDTHNLYLKTAAEQGVIGLLLLGLVLLRATWSGWRLFRIARSDFHRGLGLGFIASSFAVVVTNIFGDRWSYFILGSYFWVFWGMVDRARQLSVMQTTGVPIDEELRRPQGGERDNK